MPSRGFLSTSLTLLSLAVNVRAAFLLDLFSKDGCYNNGCLRYVTPYGYANTTLARHVCLCRMTLTSFSNSALSSALPTASSDCSAFHSAKSTDVPGYASSCWNTHRYSSACSCIGVTPTPSGTTTTTTTTVPFARPTVSDGNIIVPKDRVKLDATLNLDTLCQSKVADAVEAVATQTGGVVTVTQTKTRTSLSISTTTVVSTTTKVTFSGLMSCEPTATLTVAATTGRGVAVNAAAVVASVTSSAAAATPTGCMKDAEATAIVNAFKSILSSNDKGAVKEVAEGLLADEFMGMSTSVDSLNGDDVSHR